MTLSSKQSRVALLLFCLVGVSLSRAPWLGQDIWNLDEGSTFTMAHQVLDGQVLYRDAADNRSPLVPYLKAAVFATFGEWNADAVHVALTLMIGLTVFGLGWIGLKLGGWSLAWPTAISAWFLQIYWIDIGDAMSANTEWFVIAFSTAAFALFVSGVDRPTRWRGLGVGLLFGGALLCKQPGVLDMIVAVVLIGLLALKTEAKNRRELFQFGAMMGAGTLIPWGLFSLHFALVGAWADYVFYAFTFNTEVYIPEVPFWERIACVRKPFLMALTNAPLFGLLGIIAAGGLLYRAIPQLWRKRPIELLPWLILGWTASGLVSTTLSGREFAHYSGQILPGLSLAVGWLFYRLGKVATGNKPRWGRRLQTGLAVAMIVSAIARHTQISEEISRNDGRPHPMGLLARAFSDPDERLFVWGYFPEIYFSAQRLPATRYIYTNYLTGMIAWTNLDPFVDVRHGISPGAQEKFEADFTARPPAVIVDTNDLRGYSRFPIEGRTWLWPQINQHYAQVATNSALRHRMRLFRRLESGPDPIAAPLDFSALEPVLQISGYSDLRPGSLPMLEVNGDPGINRLHLIAGTQPQARLAHDPTSPVHVRFFGDHDAVRRDDLWVAGRRADGTWVRSEHFDFVAFDRDRKAKQPKQPTLEFEGVEILPAAVGSQYPEVTGYDAEGYLWSIQAPGYIRYSSPAGLDQIKFTHGLSLTQMFASDGYDISIFWVQAGENETLLWRRRLEPHRRGEDQLPQSETVDLPRRGLGELEFRFTTGAKSDALHDHAYFGRLTGFGSSPTLYMGDKAIFAESDYSTEFISAPGGYWLLHAPAEVRWPRPHNLMEFSFEYGVAPGAYEDDGKGHSDGVGFELALESEDGTRTILWEKLLEPFSRSEERGLQRASVVLPAIGTGALILSTNPGDQQDGSWDWAYAGKFRGSTPGPTIQLSDGRNLPSIANDGWSDRQSEIHWGAQSPQELVYDKPSKLTALKLRFGINASAARDDAGNRRSDGVHVRVIFTPDEGAEVELFERFLDPYNRVADAGAHLAEFSTEPGRAGTLRVRMEPGPSGDSSFDWAFWGQFEGSVAP